jgi:hypothetical protein
VAGVRQRFGATGALVVIVLAGVVVIGGSIAGVLALAVGDTPAAEQDADEASDVELRACGQDLRRMTATVRVTNRSSERSDYVVDIEFLRRSSAATVEVVTVEFEEVGPGETVRRSFRSADPPPPGRFDCRIGDVDRRSA